MPKDANGNPYKVWGLLEPYAAVRTLGSDAFFYMRVIQEGFWATLLSIIFSLPAMAFNMGMLTPAPNLAAEYGEYYAAGLVTGVSPTDTWTANASWPKSNGGHCPLGDGAPLMWGRPGGNAELLGAPYLSVVHVVTDALVLLTFLIFLCRLQRLMLKDDTVMNQIAADLSKGSRGTSKKNGLQLSRAVGGLAEVLKRSAGGVQAAVRLQAAIRSRKARREFRALSEARESAKHSSKESAQEGGECESGSQRRDAVDARLSAGEDASKATNRTSARARAAEAESRGGGGARAKISPADGGSGGSDRGSDRAGGAGGRMRRRTISDVAKGAARGGIRGLKVRMRLALPPVSGWWRSPAAEPARVDMVAKACSVVLWGWGDGLPVPAEALALLASEVEPPAAVEQAKEVFELHEAQRHLEAARAARDRIVFGQLKPKRHSEAQENVSKWVSRVAALSTKHTGGGKKGWGAVAAKLTGVHGRLLPICFVTFRSSRAARAALSDESLTGGESHIGGESLAVRLAKLGVSIGAAPRPTDVEWTHLHKSTNTTRLSLYDLVTVIVMVPSIGFAIIIATAFAQMCLMWVPMNCIFTGWCPAEKWIGGLSWVWGILMFTLIYELLHQLTALPLGDGGLWPKNFAPSLIDWYHSRTMGQFRFVKVRG